MYLCSIYVHVSVVPKKFSKQIKTLGKILRRIMSLKPASQHTFYCNFKNDIKCSLNLVEPKILNLHYFFFFLFYKLQAPKLCRV